MVTLVTDYGSYELPLYWDGADGSGMAFRLLDTVDGVEMVRFYAPAYALMLQAQARAASAGGMGFAMRFTWDTGTGAADPGAGEVRIDNATAGSATAIYVNDADANGSDRTGVFALFDDSTSTVKGLVSLIKLTDPSAWLVGKLTATTDGAGFWTLTLTSVQASGATPFTAGDSIILGFVPTGDKGETGDVGGPGSSTANGLATWSGTGGAALLSTAWTIVANAMTAGGTLDMAGFKLTVDAVDLSYDNLGDKTGTATVIAVPYSRIRLTGDTTVTLTGPAASHGAVRLLEVVQDGTGGWTPTFTGYTWVGDEPAWAGLGAGLTGVLGWYETPTGRKRIWVVEEFA